MNIEKFQDLSEETKNELLRYIEFRFSHQKSFNKSMLATASGLKQHFISTYKTNKLEHITNHCFKEAMEYCGYKSKQVENEDNYYFNVRILKSNH